MGDSAALSDKQNNHLKVVKSFDDLMGGNTFAMLGEQTILFKNEKGEHVLFKIDPKVKYTANDFLKLPEGAPFELLNGKLINMPSPFDQHQSIAANIHLILGHYIKKNKLGTLRFAPLDVHLDEDNIVQPDLLFIANDRKNIINKWVIGAPDVVIEIFSNSTKKKDKNAKFKLYQKHGVLEYWLVDPEIKSVEIYILKSKKFILKDKYSEGEKLKSDIIKGFEMVTNEIFETEN
ncbi:MAG: Uma2 family endonuclease [Saprospiraceae bacterium]